MTFIEALILALALCVDSLVVSTTEAFRSRMPWRQGLLMAVVFGLCQGVFPLLGALVGDVARSFIEAVDHWVAFGLLLLVGGKMILEQLKVKSDKHSEIKNQKSEINNYSTLLTYIFLGVATSIDAFAVGIGLGLDNPLSTVLWVVALIGGVTFAVSTLGVYLGKRRIPVPERAASIVAGVVLIGLGVKILIEHLM